MLLNNFPRELTPASSLDKFFKKLLPELRRQAEWTAANFRTVYPDAPSGVADLTINPSAGLDPFSRYGKCMHLACRVRNAEQTARTVGLYADVALVGDPFTDRVILTERWTFEDKFHFFDNLVVLLRLRPLFEAGIFRFVNNIGAFCPEHLRQFKSSVDATTKSILPEAEAGAGAEFELKDDALIVTFGEAFGHRLVQGFVLRAKDKRRLARAPDLATFGREYIEAQVNMQVHETLFHMHRAVPFDAVTFSNSRISTIAARSFDDRQFRDHVEIWEAERSVQLPWVSQLSPDQVIELRREAQLALPRFRARMGRALTSDTPTEARKVIHDLKDEAAEVQAELAALDTRNEARFRNVSGLLGMTVSVYGFAGEFVAAGAALGGLGTLLTLLHAAGHGERKEVAKLTARPGYVLVKAKELTEHANEGERFKSLAEV